MLVNKVLVFLLSLLIINNSLAIDEDFYDLDSEFTSPVTQIYDPLKSMNTYILDFNLFALKYFAKPLNIGYNFITPLQFQISIHNAVNNLDMPLNFINYTLQFELQNIGKSLLSFIINSTIGVFGLFDVASEFGIGVKKTDFGVTFARWGVPDGPYLMLPFLGPNNLRGAMGDLVSFIVNPLGLNLGKPILDEKIRYGTFALNSIDKIHFAMEYNDLLENSFDKYFFVRDAFIQHENYKIGIVK